MLRVENIEVTAFEQNARILWDAQSLEAAVVDPGGHAEHIFKVINQLELRCNQIWLTHSHLDHCGGVTKLKELTGAFLYAHPAEQMFRCSVETLAVTLGIRNHDMRNCPEPDITLEGGEELVLGSHKFLVIHTPGHSIGGLSFYCAEAGLVLVGDLLFAGSIGRTDYPTGDQQRLLDSVFELMRKLPPETRVLSGHGQETTLEHERRENPFLKGGLLNE